MRSCFRVAAACLCVLVAGCTAPSGLLDQIMLAPDPRLTITPADMGYSYQEVTIPVADGRSVQAWYIPTTNPKALVAVIPGAADNRSLYARLALAIIGDTGYDILLMDYEGFGNSPGQATLDHAADDAVAVTAYALTRNTKVVLYGISLGTPLAARAATTYDVAALVMDGNLVVRDVMASYADSLPFLASLWLTKVGPTILREQLPKSYDLLKYVATAHGAKLIIQSPEDFLTPFASGLEVYNAASPPKTFWQEYGDHGRMIRIEPNVYADTLMSWLDAALASQ